MSITIKVLIVADGDGSFTKKIIASG